MSTENEFKKRLSEKLGEQKYEFRETDWEAVVPLLDRSRSKKRYWFVAGISFVFLLFFIIRWNLPETDPKLASFAKEPINHHTIEKQTSIRDKKLQDPMFEKRGEEGQSSKSKNSKDNENKPVYTPNRVTDDMESKGYMSATVKGRLASSSREVVVVKKEHQHGSSHLSLQKDSVKYHDPLFNYYTEEHNKRTLTDTTPLTTQLRPELKWQTTNTADVLPLRSFYLSAVDSTQLLFQTDTSVLYQYKKGRKYVTVLLGTGFTYLPGWLHKEVLQGKGFNPDFWLAIEKSLKTRVKISTGVGYATISHLQKDQQTAVVKRYSFGEELNVTNLKSLSLHYFTIPVRISYRNTLQSELGAGISFNYLLGVRTLETRYEVKNSMTFNANERKTFDYNPGFSPYDLQLQIFYRRRIWNSWYFLTEGFAGSKTVKGNRFLGKGNAQEINKGVRVGLIYKIKL